MGYQVRRDADRARYELVVDGEVLGFTEYHDRGDALVFPHTVIDPAHRGRGNGERLVRGALDDVRRHARQIVPSCWFVQEFVDLNPEYADLVAER